MVGNLKENRKFGTITSNLLADFWKKNYSESLVRSKKQYACVDGFCVEGNKGYFLEFMARQTTAGRYESTILGKIQYERILKLYEETGWPTYLVVLFNDSVLSLVLPHSDSVETISYGKVYLKLDFFNKIDPVLTEEILDAYSRIRSKEISL